jgi:hypothetical protein
MSTVPCYPPNSLEDPMSLLTEEFECFKVAGFPVLGPKVRKWRACAQIKRIRRELYDPYDQTCSMQKVSVRG